MAIEDEPCVRLVLCPLGAAFVHAVTSVIALLKAQLAAQRALLQSLLQVIEIQLIPIRAGREAALIVLNQARSAADIIPVELVGNCVRLGRFTADIRSTIDTTIADVQDFSRELEQLLSFQDEVQARLDELDEIIDRYTSIEVSLQGCT